MPYILLAGIISTPPKAQPFPTSGRPRCETSIRVDGVDAEIYHVIGYDSGVVDDLAVLKVGDVCSIVGEITQQTQKNEAGKYVLVGLHIEAKQVMPLARRSPNARPVQMARAAYG